MEFRPEEIEELRRYLRRAVVRLSPRWLSEQVEDITQAAVVSVLEVCKHRESPDGLSRGYFWKVAYSHVIDAVRQKRDTLCRDGYLEQADDHASEAPDPEQSFSLRELGHAIWGCVTKLARNRRHAVVLMLMGHPNREIAEITGWSSKKAENNVTRGRENLRDCLRKLGYEA